MTGEIKQYTDQIVHLCPPTEIVFARIHKRARVGEEGIPCTLIYNLATLHGEFMDTQQDVYRMDDNEDADIGKMLQSVVPQNASSPHQLFPTQDEVA